MNISKLELFLVAACLAAALMVALILPMSAESKSRRCAQVGNKGGTGAAVNTRAVK